MISVLFRRKRNNGERGRRRILRAMPRDFTDFQVFLESHLDEGYRGQIEDTLVLQLESPIEEPVKARLDDLCIQGASILVPVATLPGVKEGEIFGLRIEHPKEQWCILTPALIRSIKPDTDRYVRFGLEFINPGNLYSQLENGLGQYFNRRGAARYRESGLMPWVRLRAKGHRLRAEVVDVSIAGLGVWVGHVEAASLHAGDQIEIEMSPPGCQPMRCAARIARKEPDGRRDMIGLAMDVSAWDEKTARAYEAFVERYLDARLHWTG